MNDSTALVGDGNFYSEKYALLAEPALEESDIAPLISDILEKEGVGIELVSLLLSRPMPEIRGALVRQLNVAESKDDVQQQIFTLALLQRMRDPTALRKLKSLSKSKHLSNYERNLIPTLIAKVERGEELNFSDIEDLEYSEGR